MSAPPTRTTPSGVLPPSNLISILLGSAAAAPPFPGLLAGVLVGVFEAAAGLAGEAAFSAGLSGARVLLLAAAAAGLSAASFEGLAAADLAD